MLVDSNTEIDSRALSTLRNRFGFSAFLAGQAEVISAVLAGRDVLAVMPTGGGKSLGYSLPALLLESPVLVVSPLIALMKDQVDSLRAKGIPAGLVNSTIPPSEQARQIAAFRLGELRLLFVAPERFRSERFLLALNGFRPGLFAVDEAHCITEWGHDFRPDYLRLKDAAQAVGRPPILALTATATAAVRKHIAVNLGLDRPAVIVKGFERPNLDFAVERLTSRQDKLARVLAEAQDGRRGLVYAATRKNVEEVAVFLRQAGLKAGYYHAGLADTDRRAVQERFAEGVLPIVVATNAFGMGIDRPDLRFVVHFDVPGSVEAYTQEAGRAGRDGQASRCVLLYQANDARLQRFFIETSYPPASVILQVRGLVETAGTALSEADLAERVIEASHPRAIDSALRILAEHGVVARGFARDGALRVAQFVADRPIDFQLIRRRAEADHERLQHVLHYAERAGCHRAFLVDYFAGAGTAEPCGTCAGCRREGKRREVTGSELEAVTELLGLVRHLSGRYGRRKLVNVLAGSRARDIREAGLDRLPHYGRLGQLPATFVDTLMNECIALGLVAVQAGEYPVVAITRRGNEVLAGRRAIQLACFAARSRPRPAPTTGASAPDPALTEELRRWRTEQARKAGVPLYRVLTNSTIDEVARSRPRSPESLLQVKGIGPETVRRYGKAILRIVRAR